MEVRLGLGELYSELLELEVEDSLLSELSLEELPRRLRRPPPRSASPSGCPLLATVAVFWPGKMSRFSAPSPSRWNSEEGKRSRDPECWRSILAR